MDIIRRSFILVTSGSWKVTGNEYDFSDIETFILDLNVGPTKKHACGDLTVIKRCKSDYHLISPHNISPESLIK